MGWIITKFLLFSEYKVPSYSGLETQSLLLSSEKLLQFSITACSFAGDISQNNNIKHCTNFSSDARNSAKESSYYWLFLSQLCPKQLFLLGSTVKNKNFPGNSMHWKYKSPRLPFVHLNMIYMGVSYRECDGSISLHQMQSSSLQQDISFSLSFYQFTFMVCTDLPISAAYKRHQGGQILPPTLTDGLGCTKGSTP